MKKQLHQALIACSVSVVALFGASQEASAQKISAVWSLGDKENLSAVTTSGNDADLSYITTTYTLGSNLVADSLLTSAGAADGYTGVAYDPVFMRFHPAALVTSKTAGYCMTYAVTPAEEHTFKPTCISFDAAKVGTDGGMVDLYLTVGNTAETSYQARLSPLRNKIQSGNSTGYSTFSYDLSEYLVEGQPFSVTLYTYNVAATKQMAFRNLTITGNVDEPIYNFAHYVTALSCSAGDLYSGTSTLANGEQYRFPTTLTADPTDFSVTAATGYEATVSYRNKVATITVTEAGETVYSVSIKFTISNRTHGTAVALNRGLVAVKTANGVFLSWRKRATDTGKTTYKIYRDGTEIASSPFDILATNTLDASGSTASTYSLEVLQDGVVTESMTGVQVWSDFYKRLGLKVPVDERGLGVAYTPNDCSIYDMDGDGEYEIILKWDPNNSKDSASSGVTGSVYIDCYKLDGTFLWRINLGQNIRAGAHYTQFLCYDFDGDGFGELVCKTAPGTIDGEGNYVLMGDDEFSTSYINSTGRILSGPEYLTIFDGVTGGEINTVPYQPKYGDVSTSVWGDTYGNRSDRYLACVAFLDGEHPSAVMMRGYYSGAFAAAYDFDGEKLTQRWYLASDKKEQGCWGEGAHSVTVGDVDGDGCDEIVFGSSCINNDGTMLYRTGFGHGDALHLGDFDLTNDGMEVYMSHEETNCVWDSELRDAKTGKVISGNKQTGGDTGRGLIADFDSHSEGAEYFDSSNPGMTAPDGTVVCPWQSGTVSSSSINYRVYWTGDLQDDYHDRIHIDHWDSDTKSFGRTVTLYNYGASSINSTKNNPNLQADFLGDWREEIIYWNASDTSLIIFTTNLASPYALPTLRDDHVYDMAIVWQNVGYNQPPHLSYNPVDYMSVKKTITDDCLWVPFYSDYRVDIPEGVEAYWVNGYSKLGENDTVKLKQLEADFIPAAKPMLLKVPANGTYKLKPSSSTEAISVSLNYLRGTSFDGTTITSDTVAANNGEYFYEFRNDPTYGLGFFLIDSAELDANVSYLRMKRTSSFVPAERYLFGAPYQIQTAIESVRVDETDAAKNYYDLMGRRVDNPTRGMYIVNGEKVYIK